MTLHLVFSSPTTSTALNDCLSSVNDNDLIVLLEDGVYALQTVSNKTALIKHNWKALTADLQARGLAIDPNQSIDYKNLVELTLQYDKTISWR